MISPTLVTSSESDDDSARLQQDIDLMLEAGATGAVKAIKVSAKLLSGQSPAAPADEAAGEADGAAPAGATTVSSQSAGDA